MLTYQKFEKSDLSQMVALTQASFARISSAEYYHWKYFENPEGDVVAYTAKNEEGELAGFYGLIPEAYYFKGIRHILYQSCDTMTHPSYRRMGIFEKLAKLSYDELVRQNKLLVKGFAGKMSYPGFINKLGWTGLERIKPFFKISIQSKVNIFFNKFSPSDASLHFEHTDHIKEELNILDLLIATKSPISKSRDKAYLEWRFKDPVAKSNIVYCYENKKLVGYYIYVIESNSLLLIRDIFGLNNKIYSSIFNSINVLVAEKKLKGVYCWTNKNSVFDKLLKRKLFIKNPFNKGIMTTPLHFITLENNTVAPSLFIKDVNNWNLLPIDYDF